MEDMKSEHVFALHRKTAELMDDLKQVRHYTPSVAHSLRLSFWNNQTLQGMLLVL